MVDQIKPEQERMIVSVKRRGKRYELYEMHQELLLNVHEDILLRYQLFKGKILDDAYIEEVRSESDKYDVYASATAMLARRHKTRQELQQALLRKEFQLPHIQEALDRLEREGYVDDAHYASQFTKQRLNRQQKGRYLIRQELQHRGVSQQTAGEATSSITEEEELRAAIAAAEKKWRSMKDGVENKHQKLMGYLMRRGFPSDIVRAAMRQVTQESIDEMDGVTEID